MFICCTANHRRDATAKQYPKFKEPRWRRLLTITDTIEAHGSNKELTIHSPRLRPNYRYQVRTSISMEEGFDLMYIPAIKVDSRILLYEYVQT